MRVLAGAWGVNLPGGVWTLPDAHQGSAVESAASRIRSERGGASRLAFPAREAVVEVGGVS